MTLVAAVEGEADHGRDFFPLVVDYREKTYAAGKFPGGFIKREGRPTTKEILTSPAHRPAHPPAVPRRLHQRSADHGQHPVRRPGERSRHAVA